MSEDRVFKIYESIQEGGDFMTKIDDLLQDINEDEILDFVGLMFYIRDYREGNGLKTTFKRMFMKLHEKFPNISLGLIPFIPKIGYFKDIVNLFEEDDGAITEACVNFLVKTLVDDYQKVEGEISLVAKWIPKEGRSFYNNYRAKFDALVNTFFRVMKEKGLDEGEQPLKLYRKVVSTLNKKLDTVEIKMSSGQYSQIDYHKAPYVAKEKWKNAYLNQKRDENMEIVDRHHDNQDRVQSKQNFLEYKKKKVRRTFNFYPNRILNPIFDEENLSDEGMEKIENEWKAYINSLRGKGVEPLIPVLNVSNEMFRREIDYFTIPIRYGIAVALILSELNEGIYKDFVIVYNNDSVSLVNLEGIEKIRDKIDMIMGYRSGDVGNLKFNLVFQIIENNTEIAYSRTSNPNFCVLSSATIDDKSLAMLNACYEITKPGSTMHNLEKIISWTIKGMLSGIYNFRDRPSYKLKEYIGSNYPLFNNIVHGRGDRMTDYDEFRHKIENYRYQEAKIIVHNVIHFNI